MIAVTSSDVETPPTTQDEYMRVMSLKVGGNIIRVVPAAEKGAWLTEKYQELKERRELEGVELSEQEEIR